MNPLVTSIMKARYFPGTDFLNAKLGNNPSYMWRSIIAAQDVVKQGFRRSIGMGEDTFVWKVPWLPCAENGYISTSMPPDLENTKVSNLMEMHEKRWDDELFDGKREFTVKSCYRKLVGECSTADATFWKKLWSLEVTGKIKGFLWRTCRSCLATSVALLKKRVNIESKYAWCRVGDEDTIHVFFECIFAKKVWEATSMGH
ncbi:uncharacterized protein LOC141689655 [Apium graveolens]|uniref:uncharacterized protein LOC141689655 n=1 Tax=Apium graveolens TaxID=4045 RepID=UPI003D7A6AD1